MSIIKCADNKKKTKKEEEISADKSIYVSNVKVDKKGCGWEKKSFWFRQEHLSKLNAISHFEKKSIQKVIDEALTEYIKKTWDNTKAMKKMVAKI